MRRVARLLFAMLAAAALVPAAATADPAGGPLPDELSADALDRAALVALPALYRVEVEVRVEALETRSGRRVALPEPARRVGRLGTAFAVSPEGYLISAAHVVAPSAADLAASAYLQKLAVEGRSHSQKVARQWVATNGARPVGSRVVARTVRQASVARDARGSATRVPEVVAVDWSRDLVVLRVRARDAPALGLAQGRRPGTRVTVLGFGQEDAFSSPQRGELVPAVRKGRLGRTQPTEDDGRRLLTQVSAGVERGDSGGPAIDAEGKVRGVVVARIPSGGGGYVAPTADVSRLLDSAGIRPWEGRTSTLFRGALGRLQRFDLDGARSGLEATLASYPGHSLATYELERIGALRTADLRLAGPSRLRGGLVAAGALAALAALACAVGLLRLLSSSGDADRLKGTDGHRHPA